MRNAIKIRAVSNKALQMAANSRFLSDYGSVLAVAIPASDPSGSWAASLVGENQRRSRPAGPWGDGNVGEAASEAAGEGAHAVERRLAEVAAHKVYNLGPKIV